MRSILNKLTPQKFNQLMKQVTDLTIDTEERLKGVIDLVFEKAIDEPGFSVAYGNMCRCLATVSWSLLSIRIDRACKLEERLEPHLSLKAVNYSTEQVNLDGVVNE